MGYRIGDGLAIVKNKLYMIEKDEFVPVATFDNEKDTEEVFFRINEIQAISSLEAEMLELFKGTSESMQMAILQLLRRNQEG